MAAAFVTGAGQGIGLGIARRLGLAGHAVAIADVSMERSTRAVAELESEGIAALPLRLDVRSTGDWAFAVSETLDRFGGLDVLVNNAGISPRGTVESTDEALWDETLDINLKGAFLGIKASWQALSARRGTIVNIGSTRSTRPMRGMLSYVTSKAGLWGLTRQIAVEGLERGITCNMVAPGWVDTPGERIIQAHHGRPEFPEGLRNLTTMDDVGAAVVFLTTPAGRKVNGVSLYLDAGLHCADDAGMIYLPDDDARRYR